MALYITNTVRIKPGHVQDFFAWTPKVIPIYEKYGVKFHGAFQAVGGEGNVAVYLVSVRDFAAWGDVNQKLQADADFQAAQREGGNHIDGNVIQALTPLPGSGME
ncbi:MAG: NIPSNAP family protein [Dehalococcoidia bacterium]|nr:MAG: NIPSNAP family protein [Dehalococcoidia bacterium]